MPGALPYILTGCRLGSRRPAHPRGGGDARRGALGLGWLIFGAREFLDTDAMLAASR
jgi:NitT/TauT family transport system permease protein